MKTYKEFCDKNFPGNYLQVGDAVDPALAEALTGIDVDELDNPVGLLQEGHISSDIFGSTGLFETVWKDYFGPYIYKGLCEKGATVNRHPERAILTYICSPYHGTTNLPETFNRRFLAAVCRLTWDQGEMPVAPHLYFPMFLRDNGFEREWGMTAGRLLMRHCRKIVVYSIDDYMSAGMKSDVEFATGQLGMKPELREMSKEAALELIESMETRMD